MFQELGYGHIFESFICLPHTQPLLSLEHHHQNTIHTQEHLESSICLFLCLSGCNVSYFYFSWDIFSSMD